MKATNVTHIGPRSLGAGMRIPDSFLLVADCIGLPIPDFATATKGFSFRRQKRDGVWGWNIRLRLGSLTLHGQWAAEKPFPRRLADARAWAYRFALRYGFEPMEDVEPKPMLRLVRP